jgi:hypothetical protein
VAPDFMKKELLFCASMLAGISSYSQGISIPVLVDNPEKNAKDMPYTPSNLRNESGAIVHATKIQGTEYLINSSRNSKIAEGWAFIPKYEFWINISKVNPKDSSVVIDNFLKKYALSLSDTVDIYYTHTQYDFQKDIVFKLELSSYGEIMRYLPTPEDNFWMFKSVYDNPKNTLSYGIVSIDGILKIEPDSIKIKYPKMTQEELNNLSIKTMVVLAEYFRDVPVDRFSENCKNIEGIIRMNFEFYNKKD